MSPLHHEKSWTDLFGFGICPRPLFTLFYPLLFLLSLFWHHHIETNYICSELNRMGENTHTHARAHTRTNKHTHTHLHINTHPNTYIHIFSHLADAFIQRTY